MLVVYTCRYEMMRKCWEFNPDDRPTFKELYKNISKCIEHMAGYLEMSFNPFATEERVISREREEVEDSCVAVHVIPASVQT